MFAISEYTHFPLPHTNPICVTALRLPLLLFSCFCFAACLLLPFNPFDTHFDVIIEIDGGTTFVFLSSCNMAVNGTTDTCIPNMRKGKIVMCVCVCAQYAEWPRNNIITFVTGTALERQLHRCMTKLTNRILTRNKQNHYIYQKR